MADTNNYKLEYFDLFGRGEPIRMIFFLAGKEFEDVRIRFGNWAVLKTNMPLGQLPVLTVNGTTTIIQSTAIARYLGEKFGLLGVNLWEKTVSDMIAVSVNDCIAHVGEKLNRFCVYKFWHIPEDELEKNRAECREEWLKLLKLIEGYQQPGKKFINGDKITVADLFLYSGYLYCRKAIPDLQSLTEWMVQFLNQFEGDQRIAEYLKIQKPSTFDI